MYSRNLLLVPLLSFLISLFPSIAGASSQSVSLELTKITAGSELAGQLTAATSYTYLEPLSSAQTQITPENEGHWYGWTFNPYEFLPCEQATPQSVRIRASNSLESEGSPDWSVMTIASYNESSTPSVLTPDRPAIEGYSPDQLPFYVGRWSEGSEAFPPLTSDWAIGIAGPMEATWDVSSVDSSDRLALGVGHDAEDGTLGLQTTVESVVATYDTSGCDPQTTDSPSPTNLTLGTTVKPPKTGQVIGIILWLSILISSIALTIRLASNLRSKH